jgi:hypothetical protein
MPMVKQKHYRNIARKWGPATADWRPPIRQKLLWQELPVFCMIPPRDQRSPVSWPARLVCLICKGLPMPRSSPITTTLTFHRRLLVLALGAFLLSQTGCGLAAHMLYWAKGNPVAVKFPGLKGKKVAVVCFDGNVAGQGGEGDAIARRVGTMLSMNGEKMDVVPHQKVLDWMDEQSENVNDFKEVGRGVKADMVVGIEVDQFSTHEGQTLLRGRSRVSVKVFDLKQGGKIVYSTPITPVIYPETGPRPIGESEENFKIMFIDIVARQIAKDFYSYDRLDDFGNDALFGG